MYAIISRDPEARRQWARALRMVRRGRAWRDVIEATGVKQSTYFYRLAKERRLAEHRPIPRQT